MGDAQGAPPVDSIERQSGAARQLSRGGELRLIFREVAIGKEEGLFFRQPSNLPFFGVPLLFPTTNLQIFLVFALIAARPSLTIFRELFVGMRANKISIMSAFLAPEERERDSDQRRARFLEFASRVSLSSVSSYCLSSLNFRRSRTYCFWISMVMLAAADARRQVLGWTDDNPGFVLWYGGNGEEALFGRGVEVEEKHIWKLTACTVSQLIVVDLFTRVYRISPSVAVFVFFVLKLSQTSPPLLSHVPNSSSLHFLALRIRMFGTRSEIAGHGRSGHGSGGWACCRVRQ